ncbi:SDR family oxidoreductase [Pontibacter sp. G13]|uniref:SDR family NAD(P)-dependent oxidoreductase n=1 Tax=Pontibacter sp. G13 TaxID=3074898 RepID=UPI00288BC4CA|nr:SDR family oxidoreductase [Pontibacter sp. G13]WNJ19211.1 SDR family oxidoreductase [Pontibacter sp. G13]
MMKLTDKVAIVTGASKGIGKAIAHAFGLAGAKVVVSSRKQDAVDEVAQEFADAGIEARAIACNVGDPEARKALIDQTAEAFGSIDILVNNAGTNPYFGPVMGMEDWAYDKIMEINLRAPYELARLAYPHMKAAGGSIINISSVEGQTPSPGLGIYSVSKSALIMMTKVLAQEWGKKKIRVNTIAPGFVKTKLSQAIFDNPQMLEYVMAKQALDHQAEPEDIAGVALMLASDDSQFVTGATFTADGGLTI